MTENEKKLMENLLSGNDLDFMANNGYLFNNDFLIAMIKELFYTAYQKIGNNYKSFIEDFIGNMREYEGIFLD